MGRLRRAVLHFMLVAAVCEAILFCWGTAAKRALPGGKPILVSVAVSLVLASLPAISWYRRMGREGIAIRIRATTLQVTGPIFVGMLVALAIVVVPAWNSGHPTGAFEVGEFAEFGLMTTVVGAGIYRQGITLTPTALIVHRSGRRVIYWREIVDIAERKELGRIVVVRDVRDRWTRLPAPSSFLDRDFDAKVQLIRACWHGQYDWSRHAADGGASR